MRLDELISFLPLALLRGVVFVFGLLWGSFLNVVIYRVPLELSVVRPGSHCPACDKPIAPYDNIPVLSYVFLRGRARCCGARMSPRYLAVELIGGLLSLAVFEVVVLGLPEATSVGRAAAVYCACFSLCMGLVAGAFIDAEHMFLPDAITLGGTLVGIVTATLRGYTTTDSLLGAGVGFVGIYVPFIFLYKGLLGRTGMGLGDAKLVALAGAWFGWQGAAFTLLAGAVHGTVYAGITSVLGIKPKLPDAVLDDIAELEKLAAEGDEEAKKALLEDPLTEDQNDAFIVRFFQRLFERIFGKKELATCDHQSDERAQPWAEPRVPDAVDPRVLEETESAEEEDAPVRARIPFGPFLILAILELLFAGEWLRSHIVPTFWPTF